VHKRQAGSIKALLDAGAPVDQRDEHQRTALRWAAGNGFTEIVQLLVERGADPHIADEDDVKRARRRNLRLARYRQLHRGELPDGHGPRDFGQSPELDAEREEVEPYCD
jgi:hypothetical protein